MKASTIPQIFRLRFLWNEDEAQMTGYRFEVFENHVEVSQTFHFQEYEMAPKVYATPEARKMWADLVASGDFEQY